MTLWCVHYRCVFIKTSTYGARIIFVVVSAVHWLLLQLLFQLPLQLQLLLLLPLPLQLQLQLPLQLPLRRNRIFLLSILPAPMIR